MLTSVDTFTEVQIPESLVRQMDSFVVQEVASDRQSFVIGALRREIHRLKCVEEIRTLSQRGGDSDPELDAWAKFSAMRAYELDLD